MLALQLTFVLHAPSRSSTIRLTAQNNSIMADVLTQLKLLDRSDIAWQDGQYDALWNGLRDEFEVRDRFEALDTKLQLLQQNNHFVVTVLHENKSFRLEWYIIGLILFEVVLGCYDLWDRKWDDWCDMWLGPQLEEMPPAGSNL